ncbi:Peptidoglycan glycosyltransferase MrdB [Symmachiella dynata]|uniref:Peptidoglycan glycosyltransferase MrdB n=1 Tax=Symmachiella dynata TaxID=2527995 RepID=A0A517ZYW2_9PLAN|nr:FtsW/RodA/SpoVE family cell cycle protein [Symmachiella dynata]QDT51980.1 Peptidoglycan glycosyltransferase MrdB [Symmachiella dynata]QDU47677.1 Peptidoglycan glycosyltransferase MrdB [Symmachiella dynata]
MNRGEWFRRLPWMIVFCTVSLALCGLSGIAHGDALAGEGAFFERQVVWLVISLPAMLAATLVPYQLFKRNSYLLFGISLVLLLAVYFFPIRNGSHRWIPLGVMNFQPSELAKLAYILALARYLMYRANYRNLTGLLVPFLLSLVPLALILREPDLGTAMLFLPVLFAMLFAAGARTRHLVSIACLGIAVLPLLWMGMSAEQKSRIVTLFVQQDSGRAPAGDGYHLHQSKQVIALGGVWGSETTGMAVDDPRAYHLPAARTDFIFCMIGERWGLVGCAVMLILYLFLFARGLAVAASTREPFGRLIAVGIVALLAAQTVINTGMVVGLMPITGLTLPLASYGGSSLLFTCVALGLLMNVALRPGYHIASEPFRFSRG